MNRFRSLLRTIATLVALLAIALPAWSGAAYRIVTLAEGLNSPWSIAELPDGEYLVTEKPGRLVRVSAQHAPVTISGTPEVYFASQGGLLDVVLHPRFEENKLVYLSFAGGDSSANQTTVVRARLANDALQDVEVILKVHPEKATAAHYGGKLAFMPDGTLLLSVGEGFRYREQAQSLDSELGKLLRINDDGSPAAGNPFPVKAPKVYSYGHRNPQGLVVDPVTGAIFMHEHGPRGGDELNTITAGANYGWPAITFGVDYSGAVISPYTEAPGMEQPLAHWVPSIGPSGMAVYHGDQFPEWEGDLLIGTLINQRLRRIDLKNGEVVGQEEIIPELKGRVRDVRVFSDGAIHVVTDDGRFLRIEAR